MRCARAAFTSTLALRRGGAPAATLSGPARLAERHASAPAARSPELQQAHDEPDRNDDHGPEQEIVEGRADAVEAQIEQAAEQLLEAVDQVIGRDAERRKDDADHNREQHQANQGSRNTVAEELLPVQKPSPRLLLPAAASSD